MKIELDFNLDINGKPCVTIRHHDKSKSLEQRILNIFLAGAKEKGLKLVNTNGYIDGEGNSWENYEIQIKDSAQ